MLLRRCTSLLLLGVSISFTLNLYRIWHTDHLSISSVLPPLLLFAIPLTLIATYCLCFPHRPWRGRTAPFATFVGALLVMSIAILTVQGGRSTAPDVVSQQAWFESITLPILDGIALLLGVPMWLLFVHGLRRSEGSAHPNRDEEEQR